MILAISDTQAITFAVVAVIVVGAVTALIRAILNRQDPNWQVRVGFFIERERPRRVKQDEEADTLDWSTRAP